MDNKDEILTKVHNRFLHVGRGFWAELFEGTELVPIDIHTPMWLWSRGKFEVQLKEK